MCLPFYIYVNIYSFLDIGQDFCIYCFCHFLWHNTFSLCSCTKICSVIPQWANIHFVFSSLKKQKVPLFICYEYFFTYESFLSVSDLFGWYIPSGDIATTGGKSYAQFRDFGHDSKLHSRMVGIVHSSINNA